MPNTQHCSDSSKGQWKNKKRGKIWPNCLKFQTLGLVFLIAWELEGSSSWGLTERSGWSFILSMTDKPQVIHNILKAASSMCKKRNCCLCHAAQNGVWFSFWLLNFPLTTYLIWCALSLPDLIASFLELACCSNLEGRMPLNKSVIHFQQ